MTKFEKKMDNKDQNKSLYRERGGGAGKNLNRKKIQNKL